MFRADICATVFCIVDAGFSSSHWGIEKYTLNVKTGTGLKLQQFLLRNRLCEEKTRCPTDLGCGGLRSWCVINTPYTSQEFEASTAELHFVESPVLHDSHMPGVPGLAWDAWQTYFDHLNANMSQFNAFMHNKAQLFTLNLDVVLAALHAENVPMMLRESRDAEGARIAHVGFALAGRVFEYIGAAEQLPYVELKPWGPDECAAAHAAPMTLSRMESTLRRAQLTGRTSAPLLVGVGISSHKPAGDDGGRGNSSILFKHINQISGANVSSFADRSCLAASISWASMPGFRISYVRNDAAMVGKWDLQALDSYTAKLHMNFTFRDPTWRNWDHMLDQHLGLWYSGPVSECAARANLTRSLLLSDGLAVAERHESDAHLMYVGYAGPMSWEYQFKNCDAGRPGWPKECACDADNNPGNMPNGTCPGQNRPQDWCLNATTLVV